MPAAPTFMPDPLLSQAVPRPAVGFDVLGLLAPARPAFRQDPVISPPLGPAADAAGLPGAHTPTGGSGPAGSDDSGPALLPMGEGAGAAWDPEVDAQGQEVLPGAMEAAHWQELAEQRYREGFEEGLSEGARLAADAAPAVDDAAAPGGSAWASRDAVLLLESLARALQPLLLPDDAATRFEPLKRLALHLAMELVRTELTVSPRVVEGLVMRSVQALQAADEAPLTVELHPQDLALLQQALNEPGSGLAPDAPLLQRVNWKEDPQLTRGSVRARSDVSTVEDLIQHRLASIIQDLRIQTLQWQQDEAALQQKLQEQLQAGGGDA